MSEFDYPDWVCRECALAMGADDSGRTFTISMGTCDVCGQARNVVAPRKWGHFTAGQLVRRRAALGLVPETPLYPPTQVDPTQICPATGVRCDYNCHDQEPCYRTEEPNDE